MTTRSTSARLVLGAVTATALTAAAITPAAAQSRYDRYDRGGISAGEIIAGAVVIGGIAALAGAFDNDRHRDWRFDNRYYDYRGDRFGYGFSPRAAVDRCVRLAENQARRGGYRYADVIDVTDIDRTREGYRVRGRIDVAGGWDRRGNDRGRFSCRIDGRGGASINFDGVRGLRW
ncbi:MAG: hypothetical protein ACKO01_01900 [Erythrobacter sp.]